MTQTPPQDDGKARGPEAGKATGAGTGGLSRIEEGLAALALPLTRSKPNSIQIDMSRRVRFAEGSVDLSPDAKRALDELSAAVSDAKELRFRVIAHTDTKGSRKNNLLLSDQRAKNVARYLSGKGIAAERIEHLGRGEEEAEKRTRRGETNSSPDSRRIEVEIIGRP